MNFFGGDIQKDYAYKYTVADGYRNHSIII